ncbi:V-type proton ATPase subunit S1 [Anthophora quadrimaculata]
MLRFHGVFCVILVLTVAFEISSIHADNAVPVLLWGGSVNSDLTISAVNPFLKTTSEEFDLFLRKKLENSPPVLLYVKDNLCIEDLVRHKQHLQKVVTGDSLRYFPAVEKAVNTLEDLPSYNQTYSDYVDSVSDGQLLIMPIRKSCTYRRSERVKRDSSGNDASKHFIVSSNRVLLYSSQPLSLKMGEKEIQLPLKPTVNDEPVKTAGYYTLKTANYSYYTSKNTSDNEQSLTTNVQLDAKQIVNNTKTFNDAYDCVGFTTIPIWTGIFVTAILALIMIWGLAMIIDIRTMDRFDDPKGKTITISAQE